MASAFAHIVIPAAIYISCRCDAVNLRLLLLACVLSILPDIDVLAFQWGISYASQWGHRGFTHSLFFSALLAMLCALFAQPLRSQSIVVFGVCFVACASHALLDAMTNGGLGVALYWPFSPARIFLAFRPIEVSPIGIAEFFTARGLEIIASEFVWIFMPAIILTACALLVRRKLRW